MTQKQLHGWKAHSCITCKTLRLRATLHTTAGVTVKFCGGGWGSLISRTFWDLQSFVYFLGLNEYFDSKKGAVGHLYGWPSVYSHLKEKQRGRRMSGSLAWVYAQTSSPWSSGCSAGLLCLSPSTVHSQHLPETSQGLLTIPTLHCSLYLLPAGRTESQDRWQSFPCAVSLKYLFLFGFLFCFLFLAMSTSLNFKTENHLQQSHNYWFLVFTLGSNSG